MLSFDNNNVVNFDLAGCCGTAVDGDDFTIGKIDRICFGDGNFLLYGGQKLSLHLADGEFIRTVSNRGNAENEYNMINDFGFMGGKIYIYDMNRCAIKYYDYEGRYLGKDSVSVKASDDPFQNIVPVRGGYVGRHIYIGMDDTPELAFYDRNYRYVKAVSGGMCLRSGISMVYPFGRTSDSTALFARYFESRIYEVSADSARVRYEIDFGDNTFRKVSDFKDEIEIIQYVNKADTKYALLLYNIEETDEYLSFVYLFDAHKRLAVYDKKSGLGYVIRFCGAEDEVIEEMAVNKGTVYVFTQKESGGTTLYLIPVTKAISSE